MEFSPSLRKIHYSHLLRLGVFFIFLLWTAPTVRAADTLPQNQIFFIDNQYDYRGRDSISATLRQTGQHAYIYFADDYWNGLGNAGQAQANSQVTVLLDQFDSVIYPTETGFFGAEPNPGIDNDPRLTILLTPLIANAGGYFDTSNETPRGQSARSNERELVYLNTNSLNDPARLRAFLAHEFQHLIAYNQKEKLRTVTDDTWINEMRSEYAVTLDGYNDTFINSNLERRLQSFLSTPSDSLTEWKNQAADYGQVALFGEYLAEHWPTNVISQSLQSSDVGMVSLDAALAATGSPERFLDIFRDWAIANNLNNPNADPKYGYTRPGLQNFHVAPSAVISNLGDDQAVPISDAIKDWQMRWYEISHFAPGQNNFLRLKFTSDSLASFTIPYLIYHTDGTASVTSFDPTAANPTLIIDVTGTNINKVVVMPIKHDRIGGFSANEPALQLTMVVDRIAGIPVAVVVPTATPTLTPTTSSPTGSGPTAPSPSAHPADFNLHEGDFIRAQGDNDIYIVNAYGYKRLVLSPQICLQYGHLGKRGCFAAVKVVTATVRDAFKTSWYYRNGESHDAKVYYLEQTGADTAILHHLQLTGADFVAQGGDFHSVFLFNTREQNSYQSGPPYAKL